MKFAKPITILVLVIAALAVVATACGVFMGGGPGNYEFTTLHGETVTIYGKGLYQYDSARMGPQARGQDAVTLFAAIPLLLLSLRWALKGSMKGRLLLAGTVGYFMYMYMMYTMIPFNQMYLAYIILMATSLYAFILIMLSFDLKELNSSFNPNMPVKFIAGFQIFTAMTLLTLWLSDIVPALVNGTMIKTLDHYSNNPVYSMDLGLVVPTLFLSAILVLKRNPVGYLLSAVMVFKSITILTALTAMGIALMLEGVPVNWREMSIFPMFNLVAIYAVVLLLRNINEPADMMRRERS